MPAENDLYAEYRRLRDAYFASRGVAIDNRSNGLRASYYVFAQNLKELVALLDYFESINGISDLWPLERRPRRRRFYDEVGRRLHNVIAAAKSLADHCRNTARALYAESEFLTRYQTKIEETFDKSPVSRFVGDLRNYILHYRGSPIVGRVGTHGADIVLDRQRLLEWDGWKFLSRSFLNDSPEKISVRAALTEYRQIVTAFYDWLYEEQVLIHKKDFEESDALYDRLIELERLKRD